MTAENNGGDVILVYARIRPPAQRKIHRNGTGKYSITENAANEKKNEEEIMIQNESNESEHLHVTVPKKTDRIGGYVDNTIEKYTFSFHQIFDMSASQSEIFEAMAVPIITNTLKGYNGTIFAYGQTGSGKTYTMTGGTANYGQRGLIPRIITHLFKECQNKAKQKEFTHKIEISYLEIYNGEGYDLLNEENESKKLTDLARVRCFEDANGEICLTNLNLMSVSSAEQCLEYLFIGDTNRMICATPNNDSSSRSHCVFTLFVETQKMGSNKVRKSKLNLVDLAGSERVYKNMNSENSKNMKSENICESKYINLSLHFLEQCITALGKGQTHIPYRNSFVTTLLKDSLGGNCKTVMIATLSMDLKSMHETVSTAKFAQRVARIQNVTFVNERMDTKTLVQNLKNQITELRSKIETKNENGSNELSDLSIEEKQRCKEIVTDFLSLTPDSAEENQCILFEICDQRKIKHCFQCLKKRIIIYSKPKKKIKKIKTEINIRSEEKDYSEMNDRNEINNIAKVGSVNNNDAFQRNKAFKIFVKESRLYTIIEENKQILKLKFGEAKNLGISVNETRKKMNEIKSKIEELQIVRAMNKMNSLGNESDCDESIIIAKEQILKSEIEREKGLYRKYYLALKNIKTEIDHLKSMLKKNRRQIQLDFEHYWKQSQNNNKNENEKTGLTGDKIADQNIAEFYKMRDEILLSMK